jgi:hypothetical protein
MRIAAAALTVVVCTATLTFAQTASETARVGSLTGNWAVKVDRKDGTFGKQYFNLKEAGGKITGTIRSTQF